jgi:hypothetical protein
MSGLRRRTLMVVAITAALVVACGAVALANGHGHPGHKRGHDHKGFPPSVARFDLSGYKVQTRYTLGTNAGNTFEQTYTASSVQGVPVEGPFVGTVFPPADYVALPIAHKTLYVAWLRPSDHAIIDAFVMNFRTGVVFDYAPGESPESSGSVRLLQRGPNRIP